MTPDWFIERAKKILFRMEYGQEYREAAEELYRDTLKHVFRSIAVDLMNENPEWTRHLPDGRVDGTHHQQLQRWLNPKLSEIYDREEAEISRQIRFKKGGFCQPNCCTEKCKRAKAYEPEQAQKGIPEDTNGSPAREPERS